jgi:S-adenosylmethionine-diacylglycerol 3-amino-3-carboxypropyl transferase
MSMHQSNTPVTSDGTSFPQIRYAQCWEDADILLQALDVQPGHSCLSIASAGDNTLALLSRGPERVVAVDHNPSQIACLELRVAAYKELQHGELLQLLGSRPCPNRQELYARCRPLLSQESRRFWDANSLAIERGIGSAGKFERYFRLFRERVLPLVHTRTRVHRLLIGQRGSTEARQRFYEQRWNTWRWRLMFALFFSRWTMSRLGRDASSFHYVEGSVAQRILQRTEYALTKLDPAQNPYLHWILLGRHRDVLPYALRAETFEAIRNNIDRLEWHCTSLGEYLQREANSIDCFNLSDVFEYSSQAEYEQLLQGCIRAGRQGGRLAYWNMLVKRQRPEHMSRHLKPMSDLARSLHAQDKAWFYSAFVVEEIAKC